MASFSLVVSQQQLHHFPFFFPYQQQFLTISNPAAVAQLLGSQTAVHLFVSSDLFCL
jgi:hypothetical protein